MSNNQLKERFIGIYHAFSKAEMDNPVISQSIENALFNIKLELEKNARLTN